MPNVFQFKPDLQMSRTSQPRSWESKGKIISLQQSRSYAMSELHREMLAGEPGKQHPMVRSVRRFTLRFCRVARASSGLSLEELGELLNEHPRIRKMQSHPGASRFLPITPEFLHNLESGTIRIPDYRCFGGGIADFGPGMPTQEIAATIAELCDVTRDFRRFQQWCEEYMEAEFKEDLS